MFEVTSRTTAPYTSVVYITANWSDGSATRASGVVVGINDVLTAGHVVYDATRGGYATKLTITPAADTSPFSAPFGSYTDVGVINSRVPNWDSNGDGLLTAAESQYDMALIGLKSPIGLTTGWLTPSNLGSSFNGIMLGYPGRGTGLMQESVTANPDSSASVYGINKTATTEGALGPGASGGPLLRPNGSGGWVVAGVLSSGDAALTHSTYAGLFGAGNWDWLQSVMASNDTVMPQSGGVTGNLVGSPQADVLSGTASDDTFVGNGGNDTINGGAGNDTAVYTGARASYRVTGSGSAFTVADSVTGRDGTDALNSIERLVFSDVSVNLQMATKSKTIPTATLKTLEELYVGFFNRVPDSDGLAYWIGQSAAGKSTNSIADNFYAAAVQYPQTGYTASMTNADFVNMVYRNVLGRSGGADADGLKYWTDALASGAQSRGALVTTILTSAHTFKGDPTWGWVANLLDNKAAVAQKFAVDMGLSYNTGDANVTNGMAIAAAVTSTSTAAAIALIGQAAGSDGFVTS
jgi:V8-like Glu-specific endopeptidase